MWWRLDQGNDMAEYDPGQSEWLTRRRLIDPKLKALGWSVVPFDLAAGQETRGCCAITEYPTANGPADYALATDGDILGVVEAEKLTQAILAKAFRGEPVPTEAELARQQGRPYEPASALLARIRAGWEDLETTGGSKHCTPKKTRGRH